MMVRKSTAGQRALLREKIHVASHALVRSPGNVRAAFATGWDGAVHLADLLSGLPEPALTWWAAQPGGHIVLTSQAQGYVIGELFTGKRQLENGVQIPLRLLLDAPDTALALSMLPLDHLLGCRGGDGQWLSEGGGITPRWLRVGEQIAQLFRLGYGLTEAGRERPHAYLSTGIATALFDPRRLQTADPKLFRLLQNTLLSEGFWRNFLREESKSG